MLPDQLYIPTPYDEATGTAPRRYVQVLNSSFSALSTSDNFLEVPANKVLHITNVMIAAGQFNAGAEFLTDLQIRIQQQVAGLLVAFVYAETATISPGLGAFKSFSSEVELWLMPGEQLNFRANKSAAVQTFSYLASACGLLLPRANIQTG